MVLRARVRRDRRRDASRTTSDRSEPRRVVDARIGVSAVASNRTRFDAFFMYGRDAYRSAALSLQLQCRDSSSYAEMNSKSCLTAAGVDILRALCSGRVPGDRARFPPMRLSFVSREKLRIRRRSRGLVARRYDNDVVHVRSRRLATLHVRRSCVVPSLPPSRMRPGVRDGIAARDRHVSSQLSR